MSAPKGVLVYRALRRLVRGLQQQLPWLGRRWHRTATRVHGAAGRPLPVCAGAHRVGCADHGVVRRDSRQVRNTDTFW